MIIIRGLGIGVDLREVQGALAKRSGDQWDKWGTREGTRRGPERSCMYSSVGEGRPSDAGGPRFDPQCPPLHQTHVIYEVCCDL